ncbi:hypothetical protein C5167_003797 [Papaver somniferum]|uniref:Uncharacterized protein n=1 Tax=Papaver somniferum TaxID=3469 RepID=A0A4Y7L5X2_PAPSO|nr:hypothetical protein C5167_003797 [Papaver somniferum]
MAVGNFICRWDFSSSKLPFEPIPSNGMFSSEIVRRLQGNEVEQV